MRITSPAPTDLAGSLDLDTQTKLWGTEADLRRIHSSKNLMLPLNAKKKKKKKKKKMDNNPSRLAAMPSHVTKQCEGSCTMEWLRYFY
jgi:hypothetical protein